MFPTIEALLSHIIFAVSVGHVAGDADCDHMYIAQLAFDWSPADHSYVKVVNRDEFWEIVEEAFDTSEPQL
jgi:hypothetical protein